MARLKQEHWQGKDVFSICGKYKDDVNKLKDLFVSVNEMITIDPIRLLSTGEYCIFFRVKQSIELPYKDCKECHEPMLNCICKEPFEMKIDFQNPLHSFLKM